MGSVTTIVSNVATGVSAIIAVISLIVSISTQKKLRGVKRQTLTIETFSNLQKEVLDKLVHVDRENAINIVESLDYEKSREAYNDYKTMIAKLEHYAVGVNEGMYDFEVTDKLAGIHLIYLYPQIKPIIDYANRNSKDNEYYKNYVQLVQRLKTIHPEIKNEGVVYGKDS